MKKITFIRKFTGCHFALVDGIPVLAEKIKGEWVMSIQRNNKYERCDIFPTLKALKACAQENYENGELK